MIFALSDGMISNKPSETDGIDDINCYFVLKQYVVNFLSDK
ncbi:hypothetical protein NEIFLAOT_00519 [Neisseria flavescens NRL30031/H210]|uniref:Uncharacterized protein n=1 Tax=Neisseria flavescens NRL30031/H210 TaxID=546264 RepID=C0EKR6_NEIFL|nr:hypothetical protein NEIFLAOT_00519 [Neisseria flavescens NRL30031/H210]